ncbi:rab GTPase-binding effector protein 2 isoform X1 [Rhinatrema bivittatum]|uniref:rab GTPase-binding effector protein 2 isoform X1 n=1 Tax=Rhinatrema bivittatum TaxID=194408 RepID=UPI00112D487C|nr:rab GTPase-binding effector protein 2 isoform X1 [Rhinatrema bivittatum]
MAAAAIPTSGEEQRQLQAEGEQVQQLQAQLQEALAEIENIKTVATVSESTKQEVIDEVKRRYQEEVASLQAITKDSIGSYEARIAALQREQIQYRELKERELSQLKKLASHAHPLESLEKQMEKAREDAEKLREIVLPMEQEISLLRKKLTRAEGLVLEFQAAKDPSKALLSGFPELQDPDPHFRHLAGKGEPPASGSEEALESASERDSADESDVSAGAETFARNCDNVSISSFTLCGAFPGRGLSPEQEETASLVSTGTLVPECIYLPPPGYHLVSEQEWSHLQQEVKQQQVSLHQADERLEKAQREKKWLEEALQRSADDCASQVKVLLDQIQNSEQLLQNLQVTVSQTQDKTQQQLADLASSHKRLCYEVKCLSDENERLRGHPKPTVPREEEADGALPTSVSELQSMVQRYRQEIFTLQRGSDHQEERLRIEIVTLRDQLQSEQRLRKNLQEMMQTNLESQREETELLEARLSSVKSEMDRMEQERNELELRLQEAEAERESLLRDGKDKEMNFRETLKEEKNKVHRLQTELTTSEEVQRDFVRLSQTLQVSLEQIRQAESLEQVQRILEGTRVKDVSELKVT